MYKVRVYDMDNGEIDLVLQHEDYILACSSALYYNGQAFGIKVYEDGVLVNTLGI